MIKAVLIDIDDTLLDFIKSANKALKICFEENGLPFEDQTPVTFHRINDGLWKQIEKKEITKQEMYGIRFPKVLEALGLEYPNTDLETQFRHILSGIAEPVDNAYTLLDYLYKKYPLYAASNSSFEHQRKRMTKADMLKYFQKIFVSETMGALKPSPEFFDVAFREIGNVSPEEVIIIGDSLTSDILGGKQYGMKTIWFNPYKKPIPTHPAPDYTVYDLLEIKNIL